MKKILLSCATALMSLGALAQTVWQTPAGQSSIEAGTTLIDDDVVTVKTVYTSKTGDDAQTICGKDFVAYFQLRVNADPTADNLTGTETEGSTPVVVTVKKDCTFTAYTRRQKGSDGYNAGDNKALLCLNQAGMEKVAGVETVTEGTDLEGDYGYVSDAFELKAGNTYTLYRRGSTMRCFGFSYAAAGGASDNTPSASAAGLYRTLLDKDYYSEHKTASALGVVVEPIMGSTTKDVDLDNDENYGTSTETARFHGVPVELENGTGRIFPIEELTARSDESFYGFKMTIPEGKTVNIDRLVGQAFCGNAYSWAITISQNGNVLYDTNNLKCNGYNQKYCYMDSVNVTATEAGGLSVAAKERTNVAPYGDGSQVESTVMGWVGWKDGNFLPETLKGLSGEVEVKMYYFNKVKKVFSIGDLYVELSEGTGTGISSISTDKTINNGVIYNLAGQRVSAPVKGQLYIKNGKKFIQK